LYRNYDPNLGNGPVQMVSSFRALNDVITMRRGTGSGVVTDWKQQGGTLLVSGDSRVIRVWDAHTENQILVCFCTFNLLRRSSHWDLGFGYQLRQPGHCHRIRPGIFDYVRGQFRRWHGESVRSTIRRGGCHCSFLWGTPVMGTKCKVAPSPRGAVFVRKVGDRTFILRICKPNTFACKPRRGSYALGSPSW